MSISAQNIAVPSISTQPTVTTSSNTTATTYAAVNTCIQEYFGVGTLNGTNFTDLSVLRVPAQSYYLNLTSISLCSDSNGLTGYKTTVKQTDPATQATSFLYLQTGKTDNCQTLTLAPSEIISNFSISTDNTGIKSINITTSAKQKITIGKQLAN